MTAALLGATFVAPVATYASTASSSHSARVLANSCGLPTQAHPNSVWLPPSFSNCRDCLNRAYVLNTQYGLKTYCTYNPSNGKTDLHRDN
ncbi:hypothetical protein AB0O34_06590 [Sphaerisporangium sp. NPDC088356]|uniref:hypothetical protein n=1 Tax=Sphaerisporangium sp. NPDC088356 TaxID=3154871 RepID=UPI0034425A26